MENHSTTEPAANTSKSVSRRALIKAGWILPVIAVSPLINTASAMSSVNCNDLLNQLETHKQNGDRDAYNAVRTQLRENGCTF